MIRRIPLKSIAGHGLGLERAGRGRRRAIFWDFSRLLGGGWVGAQHISRRANLSEHIVLTHILPTDNSSAVLAVQLC